MGIYEGNSQSLICETLGWSGWSLPTWVHVPHGSVPHSATQHLQSTRKLAGDLLIPPDSQWKPHLWIEWEAWAEGAPYCCLGLRCHLLQALLLAPEPGPL